LIGEAVSVMLHCRTIVIGSSLVLAGILGLSGLSAPAANQQTFPNESGTLASYSATGAFNVAHPFFQPLGSNGRACVTCHDPSAAWSLTPAFVQGRFQATDGLDPLFRPHDGATSPHADVSTQEARARAYQLLLSRGLIRIGLPVPAEAEFTLEAVDDPYGYATAAELSLYRRPLPAANMRFAASIMWDGRETAPDRTLQDALAFQAANAAMLHGQMSAPPTPAQIQQIVQFEVGLFTAQSADLAAGRLDAQGARGGPRNLARQRFYPGINDPFGGDPTGAHFRPEAFRLFRNWQTRSPGRGAKAARASIARGEKLFNTRSFRISGVGGLTDGQDFITGTCTTCHNTPDEGGSSLLRFMDLGISSASRRTPDVPLYTLRHRQTGEVVATTDPGRALVTGRWVDVGQFKVPSMRGLAARAPYFHDGSAATLEAVTIFYESRFGMHLSVLEREDLIAFLRSL
jgi:cytochrome c peroxidase